MAELTTHIKANGLIGEDELKDWLNVRNRARLMRWLDAQDIPYRLRPDGHIVTELGAVSRALSSINDENQTEWNFGNARA